MLKAGQVSSKVPQKNNNNKKVKIKNISNVWGGEGGKGEKKKKCPNKNPQKRGKKKLKANNFKTEHKIGVKGVFFRSVPPSPPRGPQAIAGKGKRRKKKKEEEIKKRKKKVIIKTTTRIGKQNGRFLPCTEARPERLGRERREVG